MRTTKEDLIHVSNVSDFVDTLSELQIAAGRMRFFRGHPDFARFKLKPSIYRHRALIKDEGNLIQESIIRCPNDFPPSSSFFEVLVRLQHYGLPTRLLDLTANALAALYFACREREKTKGEVVVFDIPMDHVKYYNSDTVAVISNLARRPFSFSVLDLPDDVTEFHKEEEIGRMLYEIREDKPAFRPLIEKSDLSRVLCVRAKLDNVRIARQDGAFLLFGIRERKGYYARIPQEWIVCGEGARRIVISNKYRLRRELEQFGVSEETLFPELDHQTASIVRKFKGKYRRKKPFKILRK